MISEDNYNRELENKLIEMVREKEENDRRLLRLEVVIAILSLMIMFTPIFIGALLSMEEWQRFIVIFSGFIPGIVGLCFALRIEQTAGFYECAACKHKYVPTYKATVLAPHMGRSRKNEMPRLRQKNMADESG